jgi:hypothetical protein
MIPADNDTPMGPGFFIFFQTKKNYHSWVDRPDYSKKKREEDEILILLTIMYESGTFN